MSGFIQALFGGGDKGLKQQIAAQQQQIQSDQGSQLRMLSQTQARNDQEAAQLNKPGLGRAMLTYRGGPSSLASTLGGQ